MRPVGQPDRRGRAADFLHGDHVRKVTERRTAVFLFHRDAEQAQLAQFRPQVARKFVAFVDVGGARSNPVGRERRDGFAQQVDVLAQPEVKIEHADYPVNKSVTCTTVCGIRPGS